MKQFEEERLISTNVDLGWLFDLPDNVLYVYYGNLIFLGKTCLHNISGRITYNELYNWMKDGHERLLEKIEDLKEDIIKDYKEAQEYIGKHNKLLAKYWIKEVSTFVEGGHLKIRLIFEDFHKELLFGYYHRTNCMYENGSRLLRILEKIVDSKENGVKLYHEWLMVNDIFHKHSIEVSWFRYFKIINGKLYLKGKGWNTIYADIGDKVINICSRKKHKNKSDELYLDYDGPEELELLLNFLDG